MLVFAVVNFDVEMSKKGKQSKEKSKLEIAEKVKEIQLRQQNWLKQRETSIRQSAEPAVSTVSSKPTRQANPAHSYDAARHPTEGNTPSSSNGSTTKELGKNSRFQAWRNSRTETNGSDNNRGRNNLNINKVSNSDDGDLSDSSSSCSELRRLEQSSGRSTVQRDSSSSRSSVRSQPLTPDMFDSLADQIAERVKRELRTEDGHDHSSNDVRLHGGGGDEMLHKGYYGNQEKGLESHYCSQCSNLMVPPIHTPMLVIPCGHCMCQSCGHSCQRCPQCSSQVTSLTCNIMLQQIIVDFNNKRLSQAVTQSRHNGYSAERYTDQLKGKDYTEELQTLTIRHEVLSTESQSIKEKLAETDRQIEKLNTTVSNISREEEKVESEIEALKQKLKILQKHKGEYSQKVEELERCHFEEANRLALLEESKKSLRKEIEKVKMLAGNDTNF